MTYRHPDRCAHETVTLDRRTGRQQCPWCGKILIPARAAEEKPVPFGEKFAAFLEKMQKEPDSSDVRAALEKFRPVVEQIESALAAPLQGESVNAASHCVPSHPGLGETL